jgi:hypothetical protein
VEPLQQLTDTIRALGLEVSTTTNGTTLGSARMRKHLCESYEESTISIDGFCSLDRGALVGGQRTRPSISAAQRRTRKADVGG